MKFGPNDRYEFDPQADRLGESPHSEVFRARDTQLDRLVALKILRNNSEIDPSAKEHFEREAKHTGALLHQNIATIYDFATLHGEQFGHFDGSAYIAMEYVEGRTLDKVLKDRPLGYEEAVRVAEQITMALGAVNDRGLVHRDLKPANLMLLPDGSIKLLDFGISRIKGEKSLTQEGILVGTVLYMSPEQVRGTDLDDRSDLFSMGSVLYHALTQQLPFPGQSFPEVCMAILDGRPKRPSQVRSGFPPAIEQFLLRCLAPDPEHRYQSAEQAYGALLEVQNDLGNLGRAPSPTSFRGRLYLTPVAALNEAAAPLARGFQIDLEAALSRSTSLDIVRVERGATSTPNFAAPGDGDLALNAKLRLLGTKARLRFELTRYIGGEYHELWKDTLVVEDEDEFAVQHQLVGDMARNLRRRLEDLRPASTPSAAASQARALVMRSHDLLHRGTSQHLLRAIGGFRKALEIDPTLAIAHAGFAEALVIKFLMFDGNSAFLGQAQDEAHRALAHDSDCPEAHTSLGFAYQMAGRAADARREWRLAIQLDNAEWLAHRLLGAQYARLGNFAEATSLLQRAIDLKPEHIAAYDHLFSALKRAGKYERALVIAERGTEAGEEHLAKVPDDQDVRLHLALLYARRGSIEDARLQVQAAKDRFPKDGYTLFHLACIHSLFGEADEALRLLHSAQSRGYYVRSELHSNGDLDLLRGNPAFEKL